jgi:bacillithiol biosynthesis cysteine-adding enzyme BshC
LAEQVLGWLAQAYHAGDTLGGAFGCAMAQLRSHYGVLTVDPLDPRVHQLTRQVFHHAAANAAAVRQSLLERNEQLAASGFHAQVRVSENSTLLFSYEAGRRSILHSEGGRFVSGAGTTFDAAQLAQRAQEHPETLSPTALLRPVMQDALFPTVAYVGGPAEIAYLAQSVPLYERMLGRMPVVVPRASLTIVETPIQRLMGKYHLTIEDVFAGRPHLREKMAARFFPADLTSRFRETTLLLDRQMEGIQEALQQLDPTLVDAAKHGAQKMLYQLASLERKAAAAIQHKSDQVERDATRLENALYPEKAMQERIYCSPSFLARLGMELVQELHATIPAVPVDHQILIAS